MKKIQFKLEWENDNTFEMKEKVDDSDWNTIIDITENGHFDVMASHVRGVCTDVFSKRMDEIIAELLI